ncbi:MAG: hypothetical protein HOL40_08250 [Cellvibrionales bacterium]|jgi:hypothetical protein|nr:hypothetical protein [Cellvibrionales bacterium]
MKISEQTKSHRSDYAYWRKIMAEYEKQELSQPDFCKQLGYDFRQFRYYRSKLSQIARGKVTPKADKVAATSPFAPVIIKPGSTEPSNIPVQPQPVAENFTLEFAGGMRCRIPTNFNPASLRQLVAVLR